MGVLWDFAFQSCPLHSPQEKGLSEFKTIQATNSRLLLPELLQQKCDECFLAYSEPYTFTDLLYDLAPWPWDSLAVTMMGNQVPALRLGNQLATQRVCIVARAHPGETCASWVMRGVMDFLLSDPEAQGCLEQLAWLIVPMLNPDGVAAGRTRTNLDSVDLNRHHHDDAAAETKGLRAALQAESQRGELLAFIDIHSHSKRRGIFAIANGNDADRLVSLLASRTPLLDLPGTNRTETRPQDVGVGRVAAASQGYKYSLTIESSLCARHLAVGGEHLLLQDLASVGRAICFAVADLLYPENEPFEVICAKGDDDLDEDADAAVLEDEGGGSEDCAHDDRHLALLDEAMASQKHPSWKCATCHVIMKGSFPRCWKCGVEWYYCADRQHIPQEHRQAPQPYDQGTQDYPPPWSEETWKAPSSPRTKTRRPSNRSKKNAQNQAPKGKGKGPEQYGPPAHVPPQMIPPMMPMMMPYPHQHAPAMPAMTPDKGYGKGLPPPPLGPPPGQFGPLMSSSSQGGSWAPTIQMMPTPVPFAPVASEEEIAEQQAELKAQQKLNQLLGAMKKEGDSLSPNLQSMAHQMQKKDERENTKGVCDAAQKLGTMKEKLLDAEQARAQYLSQWKTFLQQSVTKWKEFASQFNATDSAHQAAIRQAHLEVRKAQKKFDQSTKRDQAKSGDLKVEEISDEEEEPDMEVDALRGESAQKIQDGMQVIVSSLVELSESADQLEQRVKRPRKAKEDEPETEEGVAGPSFG
eukprot:s4_g34.t1